MEWAKLNAHPDARGNLCACSRMTRIRRDGRREISGACYVRRCRSCWPRLTYWTSKWFLGLESFLITVVALHIVDDQGQKEKTLDYISGVANASK
jgi:hypothetical protein